MSAGDTAPEAAAAGPKLRVFLSYSRKDTDFVRNLADALTRRGYLADFDQSTHHAETGDTGIAPTDNWWLRLQDMIAAADVMVLVVSPDSAASKVVDEEIAYARSLSKRIVAVTCREVDFSAAPPRLSALNVSHWFLKDDFDAALARLRVALDRDVEWLRTSSRYSIDAKAWADSQRAPDRLLFGEEISAAESWSARRPATAPEVSELVLEYLAASRAAQTEREAREKRTIRRTRGLQRWMGVAIAAAFAFLVGGAWFVVDGFRSLSRATSQQLLTSAASLAEQGEWLRAARLSLVASRDAFLSPASAEAQARLAGVGQGLALIAQLPGWIEGAAFSRDESKILTWGGGIRVWDAATGAPAGPVMTMSVAKADRSGAVFSDDESQILGRDFGSVRLWNAATGAEVMPVLEHECFVEGARFVQRGRRILTWCVTGTAHLWDPATGRQVGQTMQHSGREVGPVVSHDGSRALAWSWRYEGRIMVDDLQLWDMETGLPVGAAVQTEHGVTGSFSANDGRILLWGSNAVAFWTPGEVPQFRAIPGLGPLRQAVLSESGSLILAWDREGAAVVLDSQTLQQVGAAYDGVQGGVFSRDGSRILTWGETAMVRNVLTGEPVLEPLQHLGVNSARFSLDERRIITSAVNGSVVQWDSVLGDPVEPFMFSPRGGANLVSKTGSRVLTWGNGAALLWDPAAGGRSIGTLPAGLFPIGAVFAENGTLVLTWSRTEGLLKAWDAAAGDQIGPTVNVQGRVGRTVVLDRGKRVLVLSPDGPPRIWDPGRGLVTEVSSMQGEALADGVASRSGARFVAWSDEGGVAKIRDAATLEAVGRPLAHDGNVVGARFADDEARILTWSREDKAVRQWDAASGVQLGETMRHEFAPINAAFSANEGRVLTWSTDGKFREWNPGSAAQPERTVELGSDVSDIRFSEDNTRILSWSEDDWTVRQWDAATGVQLGRALPHDEAVFGAAFSRDESRIVTWAADGAARIWDAESGAQIGPALRHLIAVHGVEFSPDESRLLTWSMDGSARVWDVSWAMSAMPGDDLAAEICNTKLQGLESRARRTVYANDKSTEVELDDASGRPLMRGLRRLDDDDVVAAPILRGREGEDVCAWSPPWYDGILRATLGWAFR